MTPEQRAQKVTAVKNRTRCRECGQIGHWKGDSACPKAKGGGSTAPSGKGQHKSKGKSKGSGKPGGKRFGGFAVRDESDTDERPLQLTCVKRLTCRRDKKSSLRRT